MNEHRRIAGKRRRIRFSHVLIALLLVGIAAFAIFRIRTKFRLTRAMRRLNMIYEEVEDYYKSSIIFPGLLELRNITTAAYLVVRCALLRKESRGLHYISDYPEKNEKLKNNSIVRSSRFSGDS